MTPKFTPKQVAERWAVTADTVINWIRSGRLRAIDASRKPGTGKPRYRIDEADLKDFERTCETEKPREKPKRKPLRPGLKRHFR